MGDREFVMGSDPYFRDKNYYITQCELMRAIILMLALPQLSISRPLASSVKFDSFRICENKQGLYYDIILIFIIDGEKVILQSTMKTEDFKNAKVFGTVFKG